jgi:hypothetical protein
MKTSSNDHRVSREWATRPDDQRYLSMQELYNAVRNRADYSKTAIINSNEMRVHGTEENELVVNTEVGPKFFTNWSFGQLTQIAGAPGSYLKNLPSPLAAANLNYGLQNPIREKSMLLHNGDDKLRAITSEKYGRIWDHQIASAVMNIVNDSNGAWKIPSSSYSVKNPKRATTLYASDRDIFLFLVDDVHPIEVNGETLFRGFYAWNSEVGSAVFGIATFLYRYVCDNRIIWGQSHKTELRIKHTSGAPERFLMEGKAALLEYSQESAKPIIEKIKRAQNIKIGNDEDEVKAFLKKRGFSLATADSVIETAKAEENEFKTSWSIAQGITAHARSIGYTDQRIQLEKEAGKILEITTE